jgi:hypothetical protein
MAKSYPAFDESDEIGRLLNEIVSAAISREIRQVIGGQLIDGPNGRVLRVGSGSGDNRRRRYRIEIPAGGIASGAYADCYYYDASHALTTGSDTVRVYNRWGVTVGGVSAKMGACSWFDVEAEYQVDLELC